MNNLSINLQIFSKDELIQRNSFIETTIVSELSPVAIGVKVIQVLTVSLHEFTYLNQAFLAPPPIYNLIISIGVCYIASMMFS